MAVDAYILCSINGVNAYIMEVVHVHIIMVVACVHMGLRH